MIDYKNLITISDQHQTCFKCGMRTDVLADFYHTNSKSQIHKCLDEKCKQEFVVGE